MLKVDEDAAVEATGVTRRLARIVPPVRAGMAGLRLQRMIGTPALERLDPFLMLSEFGHPAPGEPLGGFPDHPHRGFETVTYMIEGSMRHRDSTGAAGIIGPGGAQWMTAGRGVVHSEFPEPDAEGRVLGVQLWLNLPARDKMTPAAYRDLAPDAVPEIALDGGARARLVAGRLGEAEGPVTDGAVAPLFLDLRLPAGHAAFAYALRGTFTVGGTEGAPGTPVPEKHLAVLSDGASARLANAGPAEARLILAAARPLHEPVVAYGPFVMNTEQEIHEAFRDFQTGNF